ncbi:MAG: DAK2 domain-containing protein [Nocardioides sp.]
MSERDAPARPLLVLRLADAVTDALSAAREEIDALNVYPVPDGDTGTNMFLTFSAARDAVAEAAAAGETGLRALLGALARGALLGARGNSGVILSQMLGAFGHRFAAAGPDQPRAAVMAEALRDATDASYAAVGTPVEGTMLTVARAAADAALAAAEADDVRARDVVAAAAAAARVAVTRTPEQLPVLAAAGVVDAGGRGVSVVLDATERLLTGRRAQGGKHPIGQHSIPVPIPVPQMPGRDLRADGPAYEVMYLLEAQDAGIPGLRTSLAGLGDSLVVVGGEGLWNVHVHVDDVGAAVEAGIAAGRPYRIKVTHFAEQVAAARRTVTRRATRGVVAVAAGPGLASLFEGAGAVVVAGGPARRPSTGMLLEAISACDAAVVVVLPNDGDSVRVAEIAARTATEDHGIRVAVIPAVTQVQGLAALAVHEPGRSFDKDVLEMTATARHVRHGAVTVAARQAMTMAGPCEPGDVLGVVDGDFAVVGAELGEVARQVVARLVGAGGELVTLVAGVDAGAMALAEGCAAWLGEQHPHVDVVVYDGGQERYPLLVSVE